MIKFCSIIYLVGVSIFNANAVCDPTREACLSNPTGILSTSTKVEGATASFQWILTGVTIVGTVGFLVNAGKKLNDQDYMGALGPLAGACVCGISSFIAHALLG